MHCKAGLYVNHIMSAAQVAEEGFGTIHRSYSGVGEAPGKTKGGKRQRGETSSDDEPVVNTGAAKRRKQKAPNKAAKKAAAAARTKAVCGPEAGRRPAQGRRRREADLLQVCTGRGGLRSHLPQRPQSLLRVLPRPASIHRLPAEAQRVDPTGLSNFGDSSSYA